MNETDKTNKNTTDEYQQPSEANGSPQKRPRYDERIGKNLPGSERVARRVQQGDVQTDPREGSRGQAEEVVKHTIPRALDSEIDFADGTILFDAE